MVQASLNKYAVMNSAFQVRDSLHTFYTWYMSVQYSLPSFIMFLIAVTYFQA